MEDESRLFDPSTNPSLERKPEAAQKKSVSPPNPVADVKKVQKAEYIPEEEPEQQMA